METAVTDAPLWVAVVFQALVTFWLPAQVQVTFHDLMAVVPVLLTVTVAVKPLPQSASRWYVAVQPLTAAVVAVTAPERGCAAVAPAPDSGAGRDGQILGAAHPHRQRRLLSRPGPGAPAAARSRGPGRGSRGTPPSDPRCPRGRAAPCGTPRRSPAA